MGFHVEGCVTEDCTGCAHYDYCEAQREALGEDSYSGPWIGSEEMNAAEADDEGI
jgi:hypothetical protein